MTNSYIKAGVDINKAEKSLASVKKLILSTQNKSVISPDNGFAALYQISENQVLAAATDGVGTKLDIAIRMKNHITIGIDLVAMVVNDLAVYGVKPLFFLDYLATSNLEPSLFEEIIKGIVEGCRQADCALIGGETAEMPGFYPPGKYDLAGFAVGLAKKTDLILGENIQVGDVVIGLASSGLHSNGFSLVRKIIDDNNLSLSMKIGDSTLGQALLEPTRIYTSIIQKLIEKTHIKGIAHITGGGFANICRILPNNVNVVIERKSWPKPAIFDFLQEKGRLDREEMFDIFNMGIGMAAVVEESEAKNLIELAKQNGTKAYIIGEIKSDNKEVIVE